MRSEPVLALDLEADSLHHYPEKICLVQISTPTETAILDPLAAPEVLDGLASVLADAAVRKIVHGGDYDVRLLKRERAVTVRNLFDTMIAAQLTGRERFGLAALLEEHFGVVLDKRYQRADWSRRPLGPELLAYAAGDTAHLHALCGRLAAELVRARASRRGPRRSSGCSSGSSPARRKSPGAWTSRGRGGSRRASSRDSRRCSRRATNWRAPGTARRSWSSGTRRSSTGRRRRRRAAAIWCRRPGRAARCSSGSRIARSRRSSAPRPCRSRSARGPSPSGARVLGAPEASRLARLRAVREETARRLGLAPGLLVNGATLERLAREGAAGAVLLKNWQAEALGAPFLQALD